MKVLYAIQGTGNGHLSRAKEIIPYLQKKVDLDILVSGRQSELDLPYKIDYRLNGLSYTFGKNGGINLIDTFFKAKSKKLISEIVNFPVRNYDFIINDFEPVTAWAGNIKKVPVIAFSNQSALLFSDVPKPKMFAPIGKYMLKSFAPAHFHFGIHYQRYNESIYKPIIREDIRKLTISEGKHYTVYLPAYKDAKILEILSNFPNTKWEVFSKHNKSEIIAHNIKISPINAEKFMKSLASCKGVLCNAGFATTSEALFLGKKLAVVPMKNQYEQYCNAFALQQIGVTVIDNFSSESISTLHSWISQKNNLKLNYANDTELIVDAILEKGKELIQNPEFIHNSSLDSSLVF